MSRLTVFLICLSAIYNIPLEAAEKSDTGRGSRLRVIVTTDGEIDDRCSMIRFLLYVNDWNVKGLIHSSSKYHWKGDADHPGHTWEPVSWLDRQLDAYAAVYPNLKKHDKNYPSPEYLRSQVFVGNIALEGDMRKPTPGSDHIVEVLLEPDTSPVWLQAWGGSNTIARALKTIQEDHPDRVDEVIQKARIYLITEQDNTLKTYLSKEWPGLVILRSSGESFGSIAYGWSKFQSKEQKNYFKAPWMTSNILENHGSLCSMYEAKENRFRSEGDTPAFLHVINNGLHSEIDPSYGGWGGRFDYRNSIWKSVDKKGTPPEKHSILRWAIDFQNDWAARADWCVSEPGKANHPPVVILFGENHLDAKPGEVISLNTENSTDPDGDQLNFNWFYYREASHCKADVKIENNNSAVARLQVPSEAEKGDLIHAICRVSDSGEPQLARYARVVITVTD